MRFKHVVFHERVGANVPSESSCCSKTEIMWSNWNGTMQDVPAIAVEGEREVVGPGRSRVLFFYFLFVSSFFRPCFFMNPLFFFVLFVHFYLFSYFLLFLERGRGYRQINDADCLAEDINRGKPTRTDANRRHHTRLN